MDPLLCIGSRICAVMPPGKGSNEIARTDATPSPASASHSATSSSCTSSARWAAAFIASPLGSKSSHGHGKVLLAGGCLCRRLLRAERLLLRKHQLSQMLQRFKAELRPGS